MRLIIALCVAISFGMNAAVAQQTANHKFVGALKCRICHNTEKSGHQYNKWKESNHSHAYQTLATDKAKEFAKAKGIEDPQKSDACMKCHVTAYNVTAEWKDEKYSIDRRWRIMRVVSRCGWRLLEKGSHA